MPRKGPVPKRDVLPDPIYNSKLVTKVDGYSKKITEKTANFKAKLLSKNLKSENANKKSKKG